MTEEIRIGIDIGAVTIGLAVLEGNELAARDYRFHYGDIKKTLTQILEPWGQRRALVGLTGRGSKVFSGFPRTHEVVAAVEGVRWAAGSSPDTVLLVGGETVMLIRLNADGSYAAHDVNTDCASGTGVFLDQQAARLGLSTAELSGLAAGFSGAPPSIATRCAVFAKTDLIHSQQQGHSAAGIAAGLGDGIAQCLSDTLIKDAASAGRIAMAGGVALNPRVVAALEKIVGRPIEVLPSPEVIPAIGAAVLADTQIDLRCLCQETDFESRGSVPLNPPLVLERSNYPEFADSRTWREGDVEVSLYGKLIRGTKYPSVLGLDIGSTSTKLAVVHEDRVLLGLYTYTQSAPVQAVQKLFALLSNLELRHGVAFEWRAAGTTGSGRQLIGRLVQADLIINEITAHAKAAVALDPDVDTVIEIGGQDSKFIRVREGAVVQAIMNYICAAGTGSFIEEQAERLKVPLSDYSALALGRRGPVISDRCTVHMERDLSRLLAAGWPKEELLASVLHSVRDNYLMRVVGQAKVGERVCFQGATGRNKALVAAFEVALQRPITVSPFCHLSGAIGVCLMLQERLTERSEFVGLEFAGKSFEQHSETCGLCRNHCTITVITAGDRYEAWGFQCGREYEDVAYREKELPFEPIREIYSRAFAERPRDHFSSASRPEKIGLPNALPMVEYLPLWKDFFRRLGFQILVSPHEKGMLKKGKSAARAEFCAPILLAHGHAAWLLEKGADFVFFPILLHGPWPQDPKAPSFFCYYTSYTPVLIRDSEICPDPGKLFLPVVDFRAEPDKVADSLFEVLGPNLGLSRAQAREAFRQSRETFLAGQSRLREYGRRVLAELDKGDHVAIALLGRPYNLLDSSLNQDIPELIEEYGPRVLTQDMLAFETDEAPMVGSLLSSVHWHYGKKILQAMETILRNPRLFPVYITNFRCSPDSFLMSYFKDLMENNGKPYLILQLDELSSEVGYQTRIEAGLESFRNWRRQGISRGQSFTFIPLSRNKTWILPHLDDAGMTLAQAAFRRFGYETIISEESPETIVQGLKLVGGGECVPVGAVLGGLLETVRKHRLSTDRAAALIPSSVLGCNFPQIPLALQAGLKKAGLENLRIFTTGVTGRSLPRDIDLLLLRVYIMAGLLYKMTAKVRPYEARLGETEAVKRRALQKLSRAILEKQNLLRSFAEVVADFSAIRQIPQNGHRPRLAILGDLYVVCNPAFNDNLEQAIEAAGGEAIPYSYIEISHFNYLNQFEKYMKQKDFKAAGKAKAFHAYVTYHDRRFRDVARPVLGNGPPILDRRLFRDVRDLGIPPELEGETAQNTLEILHNIHHFRPDAFVHINPLFCCPGLVSSALFHWVEARSGVPVIHLFYDGIHSPNEDLEPYVHYLKKKLANRLSFRPGSEEERRD